MAVHDIFLGATGDIRQAGEYILKIFSYDDELRNVINNINNDDIDDEDQNIRETKRKWNEVLIIDNLSSDNSEVIVPNTFVSLVWSRNKNFSIDQIINVVKELPPNLLKEDIISQIEEEIDDVKMTGILTSTGESSQRSRFKEKFFVSISSRMNGNGDDFVRKYKNNAKMIKEFLIAVMQKLYILHNDFGIIHEDAKLANILYNEDGAGPRNIKIGDDEYNFEDFSGNAYLTDFEWSESLKKINNRIVSNSEHWHYHEKDFRIRPLVPKVCGREKIYKYGNWNHGFDITVLKNYLPRGGIDKYVEIDNEEYIVPRCFAIDSLCLVHATFTAYHINNPEIQRILHQFFAEFRKLSIADSEKRYHGKIDYRSVEAKGFAQMIHRM